jgi:hypothetical protein
MARILSFSRSARENRAFYREHDVARSVAHEMALNGIRDGSGHDRAIRSGQLAAHITPVHIRGREDDVIIWEVIDDQHVDVLYLGPIDV